MDEGDKNIKKIHNVANGRKCSNSINSIIFNHIVIYDQKELHDVFTNTTKTSSTLNKNIELEPIER